jgi:citrate lyase subunit beta / citryl-CoA lyase
MLARPQIVMMSKVVSPDQVRSLAELAPDAELVPNVETAAGLLNAYAIGKSHRRVSAMLVASEDMVADLGTERSRGGEELAYVRSRFLVECRAAGVEAIDCPYTFSDSAGAVRDARYAKRLGYRMKSLVDPSHAQAINKVFTPSRTEIAHARRIVAAFEEARRNGKDRAKVGGALIEVPIYAAAKRLLAAR